MKTAISTHQAAELLGVHESSVKRWCNAEELACWLTPGGHRRIPIPSLVAFAQDQDIPLPLSHFGDDAGRVWEGLECARGEDDFEVLIAATYAWIEQGWSSRPTRLIEYLVQDGFPLAQIFDRLVGPVMHRIGEGYLQGSLSIGDEHRMTQAMRNTLVTLCATHAPPEKADNESKPIAVVGCARSEVHELGALMVRLLLENEGWWVVYLGLNVPTEEFAAQQIKYGATLVCISMIPPMGLPEAQTMIHLLDRMYDPARPYRLALGGHALGLTDALDRTDVQISDVQLFNKTEPFAEWMRTPAT